MELWIPTSTLMLMLLNCEIANGANYAHKWLKSGLEELEDSFLRVRNMGRAKNIVLVIGDGMSIDTVTATRILKGQRGKYLLVVRLGNSVDK